MSTAAPLGARAHSDPVASPTHDARGATDATVDGRRRIASIDIVRGVVMVLMAIDHVRVFAGVPAGGPTPGVFFTRWVTHFVAPAFVFLAGTAAFLHGQRLGNRGALARWLAVRGVWLVLLEMTVIRLGWTFNFDYAHYLLAGVIWAIGWCMVLMAGLIYLPLPALAALGVAVIAGHNLLDPMVPALTQAAQASSAAWLWQILYFGGGIELGGESRLIVLYSIVPWIGVMAAGYAFGPVMRTDPGRRRRICLQLGVGAIAAFLLLRALDRYGDPRPWNHPPPEARGASTDRGPSAPQRAAVTKQGSAGVQTSAGTSVSNSAGEIRRPPGGPPQGGRVGANRPTRPPALLRFLNTTKYPASLLFLLMTLGPMILSLPLLERARGPAARVLTVFGRVPFFYYLLHIPLIHTVAVLVSLARTGRAAPWLFENHPMMVPPPPPGYAWSLPLLYLVTAVVVTLLYVPCRWFAGLKQRRRDAWLSYL